MPPSSPHPPTKDSVAAAKKPIKFQTLIAHELVLGSLWAGK